MAKKKDNRGQEYNTKNGTDIDQPLRTGGELCDSEWYVSPTPPDAPI